MNTGADITIYYRRSQCIEADEWSVVLHSDNYYKR